MFFSFSDEIRKLESVPDGFSDFCNFLVVQCPCICSERFCFPVSFYSLPLSKTWWSKLKTGAMQGPIKEHHILMSHEISALESQNSRVGVHAFGVKVQVCHTTLLLQPLVLFWLGCSCSSAHRLCMCMQDY